jgi:hypothetical protein
VIVEHRRKVELVVAAWGNHGLALDRWKAVLGLIEPAWCFSLNKSMQPVHPLYQSGDSKLEAYNLERVTSMIPEARLL